MWYSVSFKQQFSEVDINKDGVIDYQEFLTLVKGRHLGLGSKRRKAFRLLLKETVEFLVPYKYTYQVGRYTKVLKGIKVTSYIILVSLI